MGKYGPLLGTPGLRVHTCVNLKCEGVEGLGIKDYGLGFRDYLEGQGDLVSRLRMGIIGVTIWVIGVIIPLAKSP